MTQINENQEGKQKSSLWETEYRNQVSVPNWFYEKYLKVYHGKADERQETHDKA